MSRDGSISYASAISEALPHAQQVADRWYILKGLFDALKESLNQHVPAEWKNSISEIFRTEFPELKKVHRMIQDFLSIVREKRAEDLTNWFITYKNIPFPAIQTFVNYVEKDIKAITAACSLSLSNGITEGHINRLKTIKRMMYGRANSKLLTQRVLITL